MMSKSEVVTIDYGTDQGKDLPSTSDSGIPPDLLKTYYCGCGPCHPKWLNVFANKKFFTFLLCMYTLYEGALVTG